MKNLYDFTNPELFSFAEKIAYKFLAVNGIDKPEKVVDRRLVDKPRGSYGCGVCIYPRVPTKRPIIVVSSKDCAKPSTGYAMKWSFPGYVTDRTPVGVLAHEIGHHCDLLLGFPSSQIPLANKISSYEPNSRESWAETMRLFILNPKLLELFSPERYRYIRDTVGLKPSTRLGAIERLERWGASENILRMCTKKIS